VKAAATVRREVFKYYSKSCPRTDTVGNMWSLTHSVVIYVGRWDPSEGYTHRHQKEHSMLHSNNIYNVLTVKSHPSQTEMHGARLKGRICLITYNSESMPGLWQQHTSTWPTSARGVRTAAGGCVPGADMQSPNILRHPQEYCWASSASIHHPSATVSHSSTSLRMTTSPIPDMGRVCGAIMAT
jgi:hypothetical protein